MERRAGNGKYFPQIAGFQKKPVEIAQLKKNTRKKKIIKIFVTHCLYRLKEGVG